MTVCGRTGMSTKSRHPPAKPGNGGNGFPSVSHPLILNLLKDGQRPPYFRVRRMTFLQVAVQVRLCRAR